MISKNKVLSCQENCGLAYNIIIFHLWKYDK
jgi:hypothetical protein